MADTWYVDRDPATELTADQTQALDDHRDAIDAAAEEFISDLPGALQANLAAWETQRELIAKIESKLKTNLGDGWTKIGTSAANTRLKELLTAYINAIQVPTGESHRMLTANATKFYSEAYTKHQVFKNGGWYMQDNPGGALPSLSDTRVADQQQQWGNQNLNRKRSYSWWHDTLMNGDLTISEMMPTLGMQSTPRHGADYTLHGGGGTRDFLQGIRGYRSAGDQTSDLTGYEVYYYSDGTLEEARSAAYYQNQWGAGYSIPECADPAYRNKNNANKKKCAANQQLYREGDVWHAAVPGRTGNAWRVHDAAVRKSAQDRINFLQDDHGTGAYVAQGIYTQNTLQDLNMEPRAGENEGMQTGDTMLKRSEEAIDKITQGSSGACNLKYSLFPAYRQPVRLALKAFFDEYFSQKNDNSLDAAWTSKVKNVLGGWGSRDPARGKANSGFAKEMESAFKKLDDTYTAICKIWEDYEAAIQAASEALDAALDNSAWYDMFVVNVGASYEGEAAAAIALADRLGRDALRNPRTVFESNQERLMYKEQCFLLAYIKLIAQQKKEAGGIDTTKKALPYEGNAENACLLLDGDAYGFINRLTSGKNQSALHNLESNVISNLQPMIRLFKIETNALNATLDETEFHFSPHAGQNVMNAPLKGEVHLSTDDRGELIDEWTDNSLEAALRQQKRRGEGVGVQSFSFTYDGSNPFAIKKSIKANLKIFANSFNDLFEDRGDYMYADLALKTGRAPGATYNVATGEMSAHPCAEADDQERRTRRENEQLAKLNFRLKAVVGWALPPGRLGGQLMSDAQMDDIRHALADSYTTLELTPTVHSFDIDEFGRVVMDINYLAYVEDYFDQPTTYNAFASTKTNLTLKAIIRELKLSLYKKECKQQSITEIKREWAKDIGEEKQLAVQSLIQSLTDRKKIYTLNMAYDEIRSFILGGPFAAYHSRSNALAGDLQVLNDRDAGSRLTRNVAEALDSAGFGETDDNDDRKVRFRAALFAGGDFDNVSLQFFYLSDLIDIMLANIEEELKELPSSIEDLPSRGSRGDILDACAKYMKVEALKKAHRNLRTFRVILGPVEFYSQAESASYYANLGDVPISVKYFLEWLTDKMLKKEDTIYSLSRFLNDVMNDLVRNFLNNDTCFAINASQKVKLHQAALTSYPPGRGFEQSQLNKHGLPRDELTIGMLNATNTLSRRAHLNWWMDSDGNATPVLNTSGPYGFTTSHRPAELAVNYMAYFVGRVQPLDRMRGRRSEDEKIGLFHYILGRDRGLIKNIKLVKTQTPGLQEVRFEQEGYDGLEQLRVVYDVEIETYANVKVYPGTYIFVEPRSFSPGQLVQDLDGNPLELTKFGLGGYYMVYKVENSFAAGRADTTLHAKWVNQLHKDVASGRDSDPAETAEGQQGRHIYTGADNTPKRCKIAEDEYQRQMQEASNAEPPGLGSMVWSGTKAAAGYVWDKVTFWD